MFRTIHSQNPDPDTSVDLPIGWRVVPFAGRYAFGESDRCDNPDV